MPGIFFLSGETALDEDNEETATINLNAMHKLFHDKLPWSVSFSYGKALQKTCIVTWMGKAENNKAAQTALLNLQGQHRGVEGRVRRGLVPVGRLRGQRPDAGRRLLSASAAQPCGLPPPDPCRGRCLVR